LRPLDYRHDFAVPGKLDTEGKRQLDCGCIYTAAADVGADVDDLCCSPNVALRFATV
jgi:hypothetical protein